jgi:hypothetical protein
VSAIRRQVASRGWLQTGARADVALVVAFSLGLVAAVVHWSGLLVGGILLGLVAPSVRRAVLTGVYLGVMVVVTFSLYLFAIGALTAYLSMDAVALASVGLGIALPALAAGATRGLT